ncbi:MAG: hypothetical protein K0S47_4768 [Herbinix sp.]|jgi:hypothetical protein|nr:hypothetical protein [Herbinix sp.]
MTEELLSCAALLSVVGLMSDNEYNEILDALFIIRPEDYLLLDLEHVSSDMNKTISIIRHNFDEHNLDHTIFGRFLRGFKNCIFKLQLGQRRLCY